MEYEKNALSSAASNRLQEPTMPPGIKSTMIEPTAPPNIRPGPAAAEKPVTDADIPALLQQAMSRHQSGNLGEAATIYWKILEHNPDHPDALHLAGLIAHETGDTGTAIAMISRAVTIAPAIPFFPNNLGNVLLDNDNLQEACDNFKRAIAINAEVAPFHHNLGNCLRRMQQPIEAEACYRRALELDPDFSRAVSGLAFALFEQGKTAAAEQLFRQALAANPEDVEAVTGLEQVMKSRPVIAATAPPVAPKPAPRVNYGQVARPPQKPAAPAIAVNDDLRRQIAEQLLQLGDPEILVNNLVNQGLNREVARNEVFAAAAHPYMQVAKKLAVKIKKRDWILDSWRTLANTLPSSDVIERRDRLTGDQFLREYYSTNRPVVIRGMMDNWSAIEKWTPQYLSEHFGHLPVEIQANRNKDRNYETNMHLLKKEVLFSEYIEMVHGASSATNDFYMTAYNAVKNSESLKGMWKDIDLLPEYLNPQSPERGFLWYGPAGTITPLHHDLTNNFMAQVRGRKHVKLITAAHLPYVYNHLHCYSQLDMTNIDYDRFPLLRKAKILDVILEPGEILFLPVGCWHYVKGLDISITMSFTHFRFNNDFHSFYQTYNEI